MNYRIIMPLSKPEFEAKVKNADDVVVVDFGADWCIHAFNKKTLENTPAEIDLGCRLISATRLK